MNKSEKLGISLWVVAISSLIVSAGHTSIPQIMICGLMIGLGARLFID